MWGRNQCQVDGSVRSLETIKGDLVMSFGPACERCDANSYEGSMDSPNPKCPWCNKPKRRGSREELVSTLNTARDAMYSAVGFLKGGSILTSEQLVKRLVEVIKSIEDI